MFNLRFHPLMTGFKYYFTGLSIPQRRVYIDIYDALCKYKKTVTTLKTNQDNLVEIIERIVADNPLLFFFRQYTYTDCEDKTVVTFDYLSSESEVSELIEKLYERVKLITKQIENSSDYEKEIYFHDFLCRNTTYNYQFPKYSFMAIGALLYGSAVCSGISSAFKLLCDYSKIPCIVSRGKSNNDELHAWNKVCIHKRFYNIDVTHDMVLSEDTDIRYDYFNVPDKWISQENKETVLTIPCISTEHNYHIVSGAYFDNKKQLEKYVVDNLKKAKNISLRLSETLTEDGNVERILENIIIKACIKVCCFYPYSYSMNTNTGVYTCNREAG